MAKIYADNLDVWVTINEARVFADSVDIWVTYGVIPIDVEPASVPSGEAFGFPGVALQPPPIVASSIPSKEAFGVPGITQRDLAPIPALIFPVCPELAYIPDVVDRGLRLWYSQWRDDTTVARAFMVAALRGVQALEDDLHGLYVGTTLDLATGHALEQWGELVGEPRGALDDEAYRMFIRARILANNSDGNPETLQTVVELITEPSVVQIVRTPPLGYEVVIRRSNYMDDAHARRVGRLIRQIKPVGVSVFIVEMAEGYLGFEGDPEAYPLDLGELCRNL